MKNLYIKISFILCALLLSINSAWGALAETVTLTVTAESSPHKGGYVYVNTEKKAPSTYTLTEDYATQEGTSVGSSWTGYTTVSKDFYLYAKAIDGYSFKGWSKNSSDASGDTSNPKKVTLSGKKNDTKTDGPYYAIFTPVTVNSVASAGTLSFTAPGNNTTTAVFNVSNADATADFNCSVSGVGWEFVSWTYNNNSTITVTVRYTCSATTSQGAHTGTVTLTSKAESGTSEIATVTANVNLTPSVSADKTTVDFGTYTLAKDTKKSSTVTLTFNANAVTFAKTADSGITPFTTSWSGDHKTLTIYFEPTEVGDWTKELVVTVKNSQSPQLSDSQTITIKGKAQRNTATINCTIADSYYVEDATLDLQTLWTSNSDGAKTYSMEFTPSSTINADATAPTLTSNRYLSLGQAGTVVLHLTQPQTTNYNAVSETKTIHIYKRANTIECDWGAWSKNMATDDGVYVHFTSTNNVEGAPAITVEQNYGFENATYYADQNAIYTSYNLGNATWTVAQEENYKYLGDSKTLTVNIETVTIGCNVIGPLLAETHVSQAGPDNNGEIILPKAGSGDVLYFEMKKYGTIWGNNSKLTAYGESGNQLGYWEPVAESLSEYNSCQETLPAGTARLVFAMYNTDDPYIRNIRISRKEWLTIQDRDGNTIDHLTMPLNTINGEKTATFYVDYSVCEDSIRVSSNNAHVTVSDVRFKTTTSRKEIIVSYTSATPEQIEATITVRTPSHNATIIIEAETEKQTPTLTWGDLYQAEPVSLPIAFADDAAATASNDAQVTYSVRSGEESIISVAADGLSFTIVGEGTAHLTATTAASDLWKSISETKEINATNKKIQNIVWNQSFIRSLAPADVKELTAEVHVLNLETGEEEVDAARTAMIQYSCPENNGVIEMADGTHFRVLNYGETTITASVDGDEDYEAATPITKIVRVREVSTGECEPALMTEIVEELEFFEYDLSLSMKEISRIIPLDHTYGTPDKLNFYVRGVSFNFAIEYYKGGIDVYQSTDGGSTWGTVLASVNPSKNSTAYSETISLSPDATHLKFVRPQGGQGYHYVGGISVTMKSMLEVENETINLGNIAAGSLYEGSIPVTYSDVKGDMTVTASNTTNGLTITDVIEADCGTRATVDLAFSVQPMKVGDWSNTVTITDPLQPGISVEVTLLATITQASQDIIWNPQTVITPDETPVLNAYATSGLTPVTYAVTSGSDIASIINGEVVISGLGTFTITVSQAGNISYAPVSKPWIFTVNGRYLFNGAIDDDWTKAGNWEIGEVPTASDDVIIASEVMVDSEEEVQSMTITPAGSVIVMPTGGLTIGAGGISGATKDNLILKADSAYESATRGQTGYLRIHPESAEPMPQATVELFSIGYTDYELGLSNPMAWQYVGYPMVDSVKAKDIFDGWIYSWIEENGAWKNNRRKLILEPFTGYATTQDYEKEGLLMKFSGQLVNNGIVNIQLTNSGSSEMAGWNAVANSFVAPIDLTQMSTDDFSEGVDATIYLFNTGSTSNPTKGAGDAGQYVAIPINLVSEMSKGFSYPTVVPAMQGFFVQTENDGTLTLDYSRVVWNAKYDSNKNAPLRAPKQIAEEEKKGSLCVTMSANEMADNLYMMEAENYNAAYENGYDARKMNSGEFNIFAIEEDEHLAVDATNSIIGTHVGVRTGEATEYTFGFSRLNSENALALLDMEADQIIEINEGIEYTFFAEPNSTITDRFQIIEWDGAQIPGIATGVDNVDNVTKAHKFIKDNQLFILKNGVLYNATGVLVR